MHGSLREIKCEMRVSLLTYSNLDFLENDFGANSGTERCPVGNTSRRDQSFHQIDVLFLTV